MNLQSAQSWLKTAALAIGGLGIVLATAAAPAMSSVGALFTDSAFWPPFDGRPGFSSPEARLLIGIGGGLTVGFCTFVWMIADRVLLKDPESARAIIQRSAGSWFVVDSLASITAGAPFNAVLNAALLAALLWPLRGLALKSD